MKFTLAAAALAALTCADAVPSSTPPHPGVLAFAKTYAAYEMPIDGAGLASIPSAHVDSAGALTVAYRYRSDGENRAGAMTLRPTSAGSNHYEGQWRTGATNGNAYAGDLHLDFADGGTAAGQYTYAGSACGIAIRIPK